MGKQGGHTQYAKYFAYSVSFLGSLKVESEFTTKDFVDGVSRIAASRDGYETQDKRKTWQNDSLRTLTDGINKKTGVKGLGIVKRLRRGHYILLTTDFTQKKFAIKFNRVFPCFSKSRFRRGQKQRMAVMRDNFSTLTKLGSQKTDYQLREPSVDILETFQNKYPKRDYLIQFTFPEFTSLCPKTGQPDFATIQVDYIPDEKCIESKSLKLYFFAYRNFGSFMESITNKILEDLVNVCVPRWMKVLGKFNARGGTFIDVTAEYKK